MLSPGCRCCLSRATFQSGALGCWNYKLPYAIASFYRQSDQKPFGTLTADVNGTFNGIVRFTPNGTTLIVKVGGPAGILNARFGTYSWSSIFRKDTTLSTVAVTVPPATNYHCLPSPNCYMPMPATLYVSDPFYGAVIPLHWGTIQTGVNPVMGWLGTLTINYNPGQTGCRAVTTTIRYAIAASTSSGGSVGSWAVSYASSFAGGCPIAYTGDWTTPPTQITNLSGTWAVQSCLPLAATMKLTGSNVLYNYQQNITLTVSE